MNTNKTKTAIITGGSRGIGESIALRLAKDGFTIVISYANDTKKAEQTVNAIRQAGGQALAIKGDIANSDDVHTLFESTVNAFGQLDVVVNNAGIMKNSVIDPSSVEQFDQMIATNLRGTFLMMAYAKNYLNSEGRFIAISSSVLAKKFPTYGAYIASKSAVEGLVGVFANELRGKNITVNAVAPGPVATELFLNGKSEEQIEQIIKQTPLERIGTPEDIANTISFLASPEGYWINGQVIRANGGFA